MMTSQQNRCKYLPLTHPKEIRVLRLQPGRDGEDVHCILKHIKLKKRLLLGVPEYVALSYTWGSPNDKKTIRCNYKGTESTYLKIPTNLYDALKRFRSEGIRTLLIWADAICINQADLKERAQQVKIMRSIFANAIEVPIWLGEHTSTSRMTCTLLDNLDTHFNKDTRIPDMNEDLWNLLRDFFLISWFTRAWVFQEGVFAKTLYFIWGDWVCSWRKVMLIIHCLGEIGNPMSYDPQVIRSCKAICAIECNRLSNLEHYNRLLDHFSSGLSRLCYVAAESRHLRASDPRDMLYALQGFTHERDIPEFVTDYELSIEQTYLNFAKYNLFHRKCLKILSSASLVSNFDLPGWVPDWTHQPEEGELRGSAGLLSCGSSFSKYFGDDCAVRISADDKVLFVEGAIISTPKRIGMISQHNLQCPEDYNQNTIKEIYGLKSTFIQEAYQIACQTSDPYPSGENRTEAFLRALCYDYITSYKTFSNSDPTTLEDGMDILAKFGVIDNRSITENSDGMAAFEREIEGKRRFCLMKNGYFGWAPQAIMMTDCVASFSGANQLFVLRPTDSGMYRIVGECYLRAIEKDPIWEEIQKTEISLV